MPLDIGLIGLPNAGKTTVFDVLTGAHAEITPYADVNAKPHVGIARVPDERLEQVAGVIGSDAWTPASMRITDAAGLTPAQLGALRSADALIAVLRGFGEGAEPEGELESIRLELLVADRDHVERRLERVRTQAKSGDPALRAEVARLEELLAHLERGGAVRDFAGPLREELEPLTTKPLVSVVNGPGGIDFQLELELAELDPTEADDFREGSSGVDAVLADVGRALDLVTFFTANETETRSWQLPQGGTALDAAGHVHTDIARGFIRCEVIGWSDLVEAGSRAEAAKRGLQRLEGKGYVVRDGDVLQIRFSSPR